MKQFILVFTLFALVAGSVRRTQAQQVGQFQSGQFHTAGGTVVSPSDRTKLVVALQMNHELWALNPDADRLKRAKLLAVPNFSLGLRFGEWTLSLAASFSYHNQRDLEQYAIGGLPILRWDILKTESSKLKLSLSLAGLFAVNNSISKPLNRNLVEWTVGASGALGTRFYILPSIAMGGEIGISTQWYIPERGGNIDHTIGLYLGTKIETEF